jgi:hypothetical protein
VTLYQRFAICITTAAVASLPTLVMAQEGPPSQYEHVKGLESFIGSWRGMMQPPDEEERPLVIGCRWAANKSYAKFEIATSNEDKRMHMGTLIVGRKVEDDGLYMWGFWPDRLATGEATVEDNKLSYTATGLAHDGVDVSADVKLEVDGDELTVTVTNSKRGDDEQPDFTATLKRQQRPDR